jgi:acetyltransferase-like isoleucine patch superfamily enzyme
MFTEGAHVVVGAFCSIAPEVRIVGGGEHITARTSSYPMNARLFDRDHHTALDAVHSAPTEIGSDVWIGLRATILAGVTVGHGAVIGAGSLVAKSVPPYAVVVGNPATVVRYRFDKDVRERLLALEWWNWDDQLIRAREHWFMGDIASFMREVDLADEAP